MNLDTEVITEAYELADLIKESEIVNNYLKYKQEMDSNQEVLSLKKRLKKERELYEETQRFGQYHPSYLDVMDRVKKTVDEINSNKIVEQYKKAEKEVNDLLYMVSSKIAGSISESIIVVNDNNILEQESFCQTGTCSSCGLKGQCAI